MNAFSFSILWAATLTATDGAPDAPSYGKLLQPVMLTYGQDSSEIIDLMKRAKEEARKVFPKSLDLAAPNGAALAALGVAKSESDAGGSLHEFALGLISALDKQGFFKNGFGLVYAPWAPTGTKPATGDAKEITLKSSGTKGSRRGVLNTQFSLAAVKGTEEADKSTRFAVGVNIPVIDKTDWRGTGPGEDALKKSATSALDAATKAAAAATGKTANLKALVKKRESTRAALSRQGGDTDSNKADDAAALAEVSAQVNTMTPELDLILASDVIKDRKLREAVWQVRDDLASLTLGKNQDIEKLSTDYAGALALVSAIGAQNAWKAKAEGHDNKSWNKEKLDFAAATSYFSADSDSSKLAHEGDFAWLSYALPFGSEGQVTVFGKYFHGDRKWNVDTDAFERSNGWGGGLRFKQGNAKGGFFAEFAWNENRVVGGSRKSEMLYQFGYEKKTGENQWLQIAVGSRNYDGSQGTLLGLNYSFNLSDKSYLAIPESQAKAGNGQGGK